MKYWPVEIAPDSPFTLNNIPFGVFSSPQQPHARVGTTVGNTIIDLSVLEKNGQLAHCFVDCGESTYDGSVFSHPELNAFASLPAHVRSQVRQTLIKWLSDENSPLFENSSVEHSIFIPMENATMHKPFSIGSFTDFMCADVHVDNCSKLAGAPGVPSGHYVMPLCYNSRASSIIISEELVHRPRGIIRNLQSGEFAFSPSNTMDYEAEIGFFVSKPLPVGKTITADQMDDHIFGFVILNDWSARDVQLAEMVPLGPVNGKAFATSISPWVVTLDALRDARCGSSAADLTTGGFAEVPHFRHANSAATWDLGVEVSVYRTVAKENKCIATTRSNLRDLRWSPGQMLAHLASSGCGLRTGDLLGTGTISSPNDSPARRSLGCLFELTQGGKVPFAEDGEARLVWLEDGDEVVMNVRAGGGGLGLGTLRNQLVAPRPE